MKKKNSLDDILFKGFSPDTINKYSKDFRCPYCGSTHIELSWEIDYPNEDKRTILKTCIDCYDCENYWYDVYKFVTIEDHD